MNRLWITCSYPQLLKVINKKKKEKSSKKERRKRVRILLLWLHFILSQLDTKKFSKEKSAKTRLIVPNE